MTEPWAFLGDQTGYHYLVRNHLPQLNLAAKMSTRTAVRKKPAGAVVLTIVIKIKNLPETKGIYHRLARWPRGLAEDAFLAQRSRVLISRNAIHLLPWLFQYLRGCEREWQGQPQGPVLAKGSLSMVKLAIVTIMHLDRLLNLLSCSVKSDNVGKRNPAVPLGLLLQAAILPYSLVVLLRTKTSLDVPFWLSSLVNQNQPISSPLCRNRAKYYPLRILTITVRSMNNRSRLGLQPIFRGRHSCTHLRTMHFWCGWKSERECLGQRLLSTSLVEMFHHFKCIIRLNYKIRPSLVHENHKDAESGNLGSIFPHLLITRDPVSQRWHSFSELDSIILEASSSCIFFLLFYLALQKEPRHQ